MGKRTAGPRSPSGSGVVYALLYARISGSDKQKDGYSIEAQIKSGREYVASHKWVLEAEYQDVLSGKREDRPGYQKCLARARAMRQAGERVVIVTKWLHRFGRSMLERVRSYQELTGLGIELHGVNDGGFVPEFMANILATMAQEESRQIGERVSEMCSHIESKGWLTGRIPNWGYRWVDPTPEQRLAGAPRRVLAINDDEAPHVRELWRRAALGETLRSLALWARSLPLVARGGRQLGWSSIGQILQSPVYIARCGEAGSLPENVDVESLPEGHWPALIDEETWSKVQARRVQNRRVPRQASGRFLLTGLLYCPECGGRMRGSGYSRTHALAAGSKATGITHVNRYICNTGQSGRTDGDAVTRCHVSYSAVPLEADVMRQLAESVCSLVNMSGEVEAELRRWWRDRRNGAVPGASAIAKRRRALHAEQLAKREELAKAARLLIAEELDKDGYDAAKAAIQAELARIAAELEQLAGDGQAVEQWPDLELVLSSLGDWQRTIERGTLAHKRQLLATFIDRVSPERVGWGKSAGRVRWTSIGRAVAELAAAIDGAA